MSRFRIDHQTLKNLHAEAGHDPVLGFYVDIMRGHRVSKSYDFFQPSFNRERPLMGCLDFLMAEGFFTGDELEDAFIAVADDLDVTSEKVRRVVEVVMAFRCTD